LHPAGQVVLLSTRADIPVRWLTKSRSTTLRFRVLFGVALILAGVSCGDEEPTGITAGERMTVEEQVAIGPALEKAARALDSTHRPADAVLANWIRIGAELDLPGAGGTAEGRWIDFTSGAQFPDPSLTTSGTASVSGGAFGGACPGAPTRKNSPAQLGVRPSSQM
jgi:hypothetical protein